MKLKYKACYSILERDSDCFSFQLINNMINTNKNITQSTTKHIAGASTRRRTENYYLVNKIQLTEKGKINNSKLASIAMGRAEKDEFGKNKER